MTPAQLKALLDAATKRPWESYGDNVCTLSPFVEFCRVYEAPDCETQDANGKAIVATMNLSDALLALWEASLQVVPAMTGCTIDKTEAFYAALRRLEEFQP